MSIAGLIGGAILLVLALAGILQPFVKRQRINRMILSGKQQNQDELVTTYERVLAMIRDLDEDFHTGKLAPQVYQEERAYWTKEGIDLLQKIEPNSDAKIDATAQSEGKKVQTEDADEVLDDAIEKAISAYRKART